MNRKIILASTSPFRRELLEKIIPDFSAVAPETDETPRPGESSTELVHRLAIDKALSVARQNPDAIVIGSDQAAIGPGGEVLGKPGNHDKAVEQLRMLSGHSVAFHTGLCVVDAASGARLSCIEPFYVHFRKLSDDQIENYLRLEKPYNCAGSFKSEKLGIALFDRLEGEDPNALIGLPLIRLVRMLETLGVNIV